MEKVNTIVCEGGGIYGIAYLGAFKELQSKIDFNKIKYLCGTSVGSLIVFGQALGLKPEHMEEVLMKFRKICLLRAPSMILKMPWNTIFNYGLIDHSIVREITLLALKTAHPDRNDITFKELEKDVIITATNLTDSYFFLCSKQTTPNMSVIDAVVHSCCGNIALTPTKLKLRKQNKYACIIDGGASVLNYPLCIFSEYKNPSYIEKMLNNDYSRDLYAQNGGKWEELEKILRNTEENKLLGLNFKNPDPYVNIPICNIFSFVWNLINLTYQSLFLATGNDIRYTITIDMTDILPFDLRYIFIPYKTKQMINMGREAVRNFKPCY